MSSFQVVLLEGLTAVDKAQEWYLKQISNVQDKIKHLGRMGSHVVIFFLVEQNKCCVIKIYHFRNNGQKLTKKDLICNVLV